MSNRTIPDWQASQLAQLLDALGPTPTFPDELRTLTWLAEWERHTVENVATLFRRCRDEVAGYERRNRELLRKLAEREQEVERVQQEREGFRDTAVYYAAMVGERNRQDAERKQAETGLVYARNKAREAEIKADALHAESCSCGDRAAHEAEDGSDYDVAIELGGQA